MNPNLAVSIGVPPHAKRVLLFNRSPLKRGKWVSGSIIFGFKVPKFKVDGIEGLCSQVRMFKHQLLPVDLVHDETITSIVNNVAWVDN